jgi:hypothetical protein
MPQRVQEQALGFYERLFIKVLQAGHGTLAAVMPSTRRVLPQTLRDGIQLGQPIAIAQYIEDVVAKGDSESNTRLNAIGALISGMLLSDGITLFASDGSVRAFNTFIKHPRRQAEHGARFGGARRRTFDLPCTMIDTSLTGVFMQSQDGRVEYK